MTDQISLFDDLFGEQTRVNEEIKDKGYAITDGKPVYYDIETLRISPKILYRFCMSGRRYYYDFLDMMKTAPRFYISVTSSIASLDLLATGKGLLEYYNKFDRIEDVYRDMQRRADYGTFFHILAARFFREGVIGLNEIPYFVVLYKERNQLDYDNRWWIKRTQRDLIALEIWAKEHEVKPLAVELMLSGSEGYATAIDLICQMTIGTSTNGRILQKDIKSANTQRVTAIVDYKTGDGFYESHHFQLEACRRLVNENIPGLKIDKLYNISPKGLTDMRCEMQDQTGKANYPVMHNGCETTLFDLYWSIYKAKFPCYNKPQDMTEISGYIALAEKSEYSLGGRNPREIVVEKHRKDF